MRQLVENPESPLHQFRENIILVEDPIINNISSTILRQQVAQVTLYSPPAKCKEKGPRRL